MKDKRLDTLTSIDGGPKRPSLTFVRTTEQQSFSTNDVLLLTSDFTNSMEECREGVKGGEREGRVCVLFRAL